MDRASTRARTLLRVPGGSTARTRSGSVDLSRASVAGRPDSWPGSSRSWAAQPSADRAFTATSTAPPNSDRPSARPSPCVACKATVEAGVLKAWVEWVTADPARWHEHVRGAAPARSTTVDDGLRTVYATVYVSLTRGFTVYADYI